MTLTGGPGSQKVTTIHLQMTKNLIILCSELKTALKIGSHKSQFFSNQVEIKT